LDSYADNAATAIFKGLPVGERGFGGDDYPAPLIDVLSINESLNRIQHMKQTVE
jgi:hypothetical protein